MQPSPQENQQYTEAKDLVLACYSDPLSSESVTAPKFAHELEQSDIVAAIDVVLDALTHHCEDHVSQTKVIRDALILAVDGEVTRARNRFDEMCDVDPELPRRNDDRLGLWILTLMQHSKSKPGTELVELATRSHDLLPRSIIERALALLLYELKHQGQGNQEQRAEALDRVLAYCNHSRGLYPGVTAKELVGNEWRLDEALTDWKGKGYPPTVQAMALSMLCELVPKVGEPDDHAWRFALLLRLVESCEALSQDLCAIGDQCLKDSLKNELRACAGQLFPAESSEYGALRRRLENPA